MAKKHIPTYAALIAADQEAKTLAIAHDRLLAKIADLKRGLTILDGKAEPIEKQLEVLGRMEKDACVLDPALDVGGRSPLVRYTMIGLITSAQSLLQQRLTKIATTRKDARAMLTASEKELREMEDA